MQNASSCSSMCNCSPSWFVCRMVKERSETGEGVAAETFLLVLFLSCVNPNLLSDLSFFLCSLWSNKIFSEFVIMRVKCKTSFFIIGLLEHGDSAIGDKSFDFPDLLAEVGVWLNMPPFHLGKQQFTLRKVL